MIAKPADESAERRSSRVLVVDDHEWNLKLLQALLKSSGHEVVGAGTGRQALERVASFRPHLILLDLELPDVDGLTLARQLKSGAATRGIRIVVLTAHAVRDVEVAVREAGCDGLLTKPVDPGTFRETVRRYLTAAGAGFQ